ncbi:MAG: universal stress protein [bacterium]
MKPIERVLVAYDFESSSEEALKAAAFLCHRLKGRLTALHIVSQTPFEGHFFGPVSVDLVNQIERKASEELTRRVKDIVGQDLEVIDQVTVGVPFVDLLRFAKQQKAQFLFVGTHGRGSVEKLLLGSVAESTVRKSECPVWVMRGAFSPPRKILLLTDLSENGKWGFRLGLFLAKIFGAAVHLLHVFEKPYIPSFTMIDPTEYELKMKEMVREEFQKWVEEAHVSKVEVSQELAEGSVRGKIDEVLKRENFDLVVLGTHGRSGLFHKHLGSVTTHLVRHAPCSVVTVRPEGFKLKEI